MQHIATIQLSDKLLHAIKAQTPDSLEILTNELSGSKEIIFILQGYDYLNEPNAQVNHFDIKPDTIAIDEKGHGNIGVKYNAEFYYACDSVTTRHPQEMNITIKVDFIHGGALLSGIDLPERGPDDL